MSEVVAAQRALPQRSRVARLFGVSPLDPVTRLLYRSALGELLVGDTLDNLGPEWDVLHVIPVDAGAPDGGTTDIDHLVIGPPGVFILATENFPGEEIWVGGDTLLVGTVHHDGIAVANRLAESAAALLSAAADRPVEVEPLIVLVNPKKLVLREQPAGLAVVSSRQLLRWLTRLDRTLLGTEIAFISDVADRDSTWQSAPGPAQDTQQLNRDFALLREEVRGASRRRVVWAFVAFLAVGCVAWTATVLIVQALMPH